MQTPKKPDGHQVMPYPLRLPPALREELSSEAALNRRSLNSEIVVRLEKSRADELKQGTQQ